VNGPARPNVVRLYLEQERIAQEELADRAKVSQPTVSRALARQPKRHSRAHAKLVAFIHQQSRVPAPPPATVAAALEEVWDGTEAHETALAHLIAASAELWPKMKGGE
jgi:transcriptional regulator with XRE-family HTH domain